MASNQPTQPLPRRGGPPRAGAADDPQTLMTRRIIAVAVVILFVVVVLFLIKGCASQRKERALKDFVRQTNSIVTQSNQSSKDFFGLLRTPGDAGATDIETSINQERSLASELVRQANNLDAPGDMSLAKRYLVQTLEFRRDGLTAVSTLIGQALGDQDPESATEEIAANMQNFITSDVIYSQRSYAYMRDALKQNDVAGVTPPTSQFLPSLDWLDPAIVDDVLSRARGGSSSAEVAPGLHGTGVTGVKALPSGDALVAGGSNSLSGVRSIAVDVQNQGENNEKDVVVTLQITGAGSPIRLQQDITSIDPGETKTVTIPITRTPAKGTTASLKIEVRRVPGEENTDNNRQSFDVTF